MRTGSIIAGIFATIWWFAGTRNSEWPVILLFGIPSIIFTFIIITAKKGNKTSAVRSKSGGRRVGRLVGFASGVEGILIIVTVNVLTNIGKPELLLPIIAIIVGLHFLPLARWLPVKLFYYSAGGLIILGIFGFLISDAVLRLRFICLGSAAILWVTSYILIHTQSQLQSGN